MNKMRASVAVVVRPVLLAIAAGGVLLTFAASGASRAGASEGNRQPGQKRDIVVRLRERQVLFVAPDNAGTRQWGVYGCPLMHRAADGSIVVYDGGHGDTYDAEAGARRRRSPSGPATTASPGSRSKMNSLRTTAFPTSGSRWPAARV